MTEEGYYALKFLEVLAFITFWVLLAASLYMLINFYVCDGHNCKAFDDASTHGVTGGKDFHVALLHSLHNDGIWCLPYIGAAISTPLALWFANVKLTLLNFAIVFFITFAVMYFMFAFVGHHYVKVIAREGADYIENVCKGSPEEEKKFREKVANEKKKNEDKK